MNVLTRLRIYTKSTLKKHIDVVHLKIKRSRGAK